MKLKSNFFIQPAKGFDLNSQGRTELQLDEYEAKIGFKLPANYRQIMTLQNGGSVRYGKIAGENDFSFYEGFSAIRPDLAYITNFKDYILVTCYEDELAEAQKELAPFYPERLVLFSSLDGHGAACFDYGYRLKAPVENPMVIFISDDGNNFLHFGVFGPQFASFDAFLQSLAYDAESDDSIYLGIISSGDYDATVQTLAKQLDLSLKAYVNDDRNGHFNFDVWYSTHVPLELDDETMQLYSEENGITLGKVRRIYSIFSPNQHRAGTYLYQDNPEVTVVIEIRKSWFPMQNPIAGLMEKLKRLPTILDVVRLPR